jgi:hypothetical protein
VVVERGDARLIARVPELDEAVGRRGEELLAGREEIDAEDRV